MRTPLGYASLRATRGHYQGDARDNRPLFAQPAGTAERLAREPAQFVNQGASI